MWLNADISAADVVSKLVLSHGEVLISSSRQMVVYHVYDTDERSRGYKLPRSLYDL